MPEIILKGMTWGHSRGITPLLAFSQRFSELNPNVKIIWEKRSLQEFADFPIEKLAENYDLLIVDHPWVGCAAATNCVLPLNEYLSEAYLNDQAVNSVGASHNSYNYNNKQWALAIDAATPVASYRADLLQLNNCRVPESWEDLIALAFVGKVALPAIPIDLLMNFYMFCIAHGEEPFINNEEVLIKNVNYVPNIKTTLISSNELTKKGWLILFKDAKAIISHEETKLQLIANWISNAYYIDIDINIDSICDFELIQNLLVTISMPILSWVQILLGIIHLNTCIACITY